MAKATFKWSKSGYTALMNEGGVQGVLDEVAEKIADNAGSMLSPDWGKPPEDDHFTVGSWHGTKMGVTARVVYAHTEHARRSQAENKTLTKAFKGMRKK